LDPVTQNTLRAAEKAVNCLVKECRKPGPLYARNPQAVAHVSRTGKWLLKAIAVLRRSLRTPPAEEDSHA
jgi:hypothetical protein